MNIAGDSIWQIVVMVLGIALAWMQHRATAAATEAARKAEEIRGIAVATHILVNSAMQAQLHIAWTALHRVAELTGKEEDRAAAAAAKKLFSEHKAKQAVVDNGGGPVGG